MLLSIQEARLRGYHIEPIEEPWCYLFHANSHQLIYIGRPPRSPVSIMGDQ